LPGVERAGEYGRIAAGRLPVHVASAPKRRTLHALIHRACHGVRHGVRISASVL